MDPERAGMEPEKTVKNPEMDLNGA